MKKNEKGFTLIELLTVISIISLLSTIAFTSLEAARRKARDARRQLDLNNIILALDQYHSGHGTYFIVGTAWAPVDGIGTGRGWFNYETGDPTGSYSKSIARGMQEEGLFVQVPIDPLIPSYNYTSYASGTAHQYKIGSCAVFSPDCVCVYADMEVIGKSTVAEASAYFVSVGCNDVSAEGMNYVIKHAL